MPLYDLRCLIEPARRGGYAVGSFNVFGMESLLGILDAASKQRSPVVVAIAESHLPYLDLESFMPMALTAAQRADIPVAVHLDHARSLEMIARALRAGFTSVMFDGYGLEYDEKVAQTQLVVRMAHAVGVPVETELGHVGRSGLVDESGEAGELADPSVVQDFVQRTGVDVLAVAVGSTHGMAAPEAGLDLDRLGQIVRAVECYLSLHGGSGISASHLRSAIDLGVSKVSVFTTLARHALAQVIQYLECHDAPDLPDVCQQIRAGFESGVSDQIARLGSGERV